MKLKLILLTFRDFCVIRGQKIQTLNNQLIKTLAENQKLPIVAKAQHQVKAAARTLTNNTRVSKPLALNALLDYYLKSPYCSHKVVSILISTTLIPIIKYLIP